MSAGPLEKPVVFHGVNPIKTPPMGPSARALAGRLLGRLQRGEIPPFPHCRSMKSIGPGVQELRIEDFPVSWRIIFRVDPEAIVVVSLFEKRGRKTRKADIDLARKRFREYDRSRSRE